MTTTSRPRTEASWSDLVHPGVFEEGVPHELIERMRAEGPVVWVEEPPLDHLPAGSGFWAVLGHAEVGEVLRTPGTYSSSLGLTQLYDAPPPLLDHYRSMMLNMDPPDHTRLRRVVGKAFTPAAVRHLEENIHRRCRDLVAAVTPESGTGRCDFAREVVTELPLQTLADLLGMPPEDRWLMFDWANRVIGMMDDEYHASQSFDPSQASPMARAAMEARPRPDESGRLPDPRHPSGMADLYAYARALADHLRKHPGPDVMSQVLARADEDGITTEEFENLFWLFCVAGNETVRNAVPGGLMALLVHPEQQRRLWERPEGIDRAVEEMLRWWTAVVHFRRTATTDTELADQQIHAGDKVVVFYTAANRDGAVFPDAAELDLERHPNPHLAFGTGPHYCIGAVLARAQMRSMILAVMERWTDVRLAGDPVRLRANFQNGIKHLPVEFTVREQPPTTEGPTADGPIAEGPTAGCPA